MKKLSSGDWVQVRSREEILGTLDSNGCIDGMPFMPEMLAYAGQRFQVFRRAHKSCDTVHKVQGLRVTDSVHLEDVRCTGASHGGCEAACMIFWKTHWLKRVDGRDGANPRPAGPDIVSPGINESQLLATARAGGADDDPIYSCQATKLPSASTPLRWWDLRQYVEDVTSRNVSALELLRGAVYSVTYSLIKFIVRWPRIHRRAISLYDYVQRIRGGVPYPRRRGPIPIGQKTPENKLDFAPGEMVRVQSYEKILSTLDWANNNRGLYFDAEAVPYCGETFRVRCRVNKIIDEKTGKIIPIKGNSVILDGAWCKAHYSYGRMHCPRAVFPIWRETWLERVDPTDKA